MSNKTLPQEPPWTGMREVLTMAVPIILGIVSHTVMQFFDQVMVSRLGPSALAAVGSASLWSFTLATFFLGVVGCVGTFVSQSYGRGETDDCARYTWQGIYIAIVTGSCTIALWFLAPAIFGLMGHTEEVTRLEVVYFRVRLFGFVFIAWHTALVSFFQAVNRPILPTYVAFFAAALNIVLNYGLIFGRLGLPRWEVKGAAVATVVALMTQVVILQAVFLSRRYDRVFHTRSAYALDMGKVRELLRIGWAAGASFFMDVFNWGIFTSFLVGRFGTTALAAHVAGTNFMQVSFMPAVGLNHAIAPIVGQWIGRGRVDMAKARTYSALKLAIAYMTVMGLVLAIFGDRLIWLFFSKDPEIISLGHKFLILAAVFQAFDATNIVVMGALRGAGDTRWIAVATFVIAYLIFLPAAWFLAFMMDLGAIGAWLGATAYIILLAMVLFARFKSEAWRNIRIFDRDVGPMPPVPPQPTVTPKPAR